MSAGGDPLDDPQWEWVRATARAPVPTPPGLIERVLRSVHGVRGGLPAEPLEIAQEGGRLRVGERAVVLLTRRLGADLAARIGGLHVSAVAFEAGVLEVVVTVEYGLGADTAAETLRIRLQAALRAELGPAAPAVNVHIADVYRN
ncbi:hypothetical protein B0I33_101490 [Prauserella shujinwangii]|uniref:Uncharacterized protein n=1 Tax=Prauserella shujinwangii TaxID=1453103 RepID=A0A2T0M3M4_9PSEU|nr:hypothetical protein [Prauserella shujinwangii]PRX51337.1 hypothetical protein B0I33_101490 [Prauserella shujinwangii]